MEHNSILQFMQAKPVWAEGRETEKNLTMGFRTIFDKPEPGPVVLKITASTIYRFFINGRFGGHGPARGPHGFYRVDEWDLSGLLDEGRNIIAIEVAGYNINSYYLLDQPSFLQAEVFSGEEVIAWTGTETGSFEAVIIGNRVQKVQKYSFQRTFVEAYTMKSHYDRWRKSDCALNMKVDLCETSRKNLIQRGVEYPEFCIRNPLYEIAEGTVKKLDKVEEYWRDRALTDVSPKLKGYHEDELECILSYELDEIETVRLEEKLEKHAEDKAITIDPCTFRTFDFGHDCTGFIGLELECDEEALIYLTFDEILTENDVSHKRYQCVNGIKYQLESGNYILETMDPYTLKYLKVIIIKGQAVIKDIYIREYAGTNIKNAGFKSNNDKLNRIFDAGVETFRQNSIDIYMDCPSRERAGWLCDSFFTSRVEYDLTGKSLIEKNFLENFLLPEKFEYLPEGMLPMCYPADHYDGVFIPNWALWFVIELEEYLNRSKDTEMIEKFREKIYLLFKYFERFKNDYGLLEKLENWVFVEWSKANDFVQDVNYPTNMLYSYAMEVAGRLYHDTAMLEEAKRLRNVIRQQAYDGEFFADNALREDGVLKVTENRTEVCQYSAFFFKIATPEAYPGLWSKLVDEFGPDRNMTGKYSDVFAANAFIGNYLRLEILSMHGLGNKVIENVEDYFYYMAEKTGTLWELVDGSSSCNHGFASHAIHCLYRNALGIVKIDKDNKEIVIKHTGANIVWCEGWLPVDGSMLYVKWDRKDGKIIYKVDAPEGYEIRIL